MDYHAKLVSELMKQRLREVESLVQGRTASEEVKVQIHVTRAACWVYLGFGGHRGERRGAWSGVGAVCGVCV